MRPNYLLILLFLFCCTLGFTQNPIKRTALLWDSSFGMEPKNVSAEFSYLNSYFTKNPNVELRLLIFSNSVVQNKVFTIREGNWAQLKTELQEVIYDGASSFKGVFPKAVDEIILVSDGIGIDQVPQNIFTPVYIMNSVSKNKEKELQLLAVTTGGAYFDMTKPKEASDTEVAINKVTTRSTDNEQTLPKRNEREALGEVLINAPKDEDVELVNTGIKQVDKRSLGYSIETISAEDVGEQDIELKDAVRGQFTNLEMRVDGAQFGDDLSQFLGRHKNMTILGNQYGMVVIDGVPMTQSDSSEFNTENAPAFATSPIDLTPNVTLSQVTPTLNPDNIASITYLKGLAATNKYGSMGAAGVILITTKTGSKGRSSATKEKTIGTTATYTGGATQINSLPDTPYMHELKKATDINEACNIYLEQRKVYGNIPSFYIHCASYFKDWNNPIIVKRVLSNIAEIPDVKISSLLAMAYKYEELKMEDQAFEMYKQLLIRDSKQLQHYRNYALALHENKNYQESLAFYNNIDRHNIPEIVGYNGLKSTLETEFKNLIALRKNELSTTYVRQDLLKDTPLDTRIVFEWNVFDAPFDLQIVNPQNRFFTWSHTQQAEKSRMTQEQVQGYGLEEYFMTASDKGDWLFNVTYLDENSKIEPVFLKVTTYTNYGKPNQSETIKVIPLENTNTKETVLTVRI